MQPLCTGVPSWPAKGPLIGAVFTWDSILTKKHLLAREPPKRSLLWPETHWWCYPGLCGDTPSMIWRKVWMLDSDTFNLRGKGFDVHALLQLLCAPDPT